MVVKNKFEDSTFEFLKKHEKKGKYTVGYETLKLPYFIQRDYIGDFILTFKDGRIRIIETKGYFRPEDQRKMRAVKERNPEADIRILFYTNKPIRKGAKMRYSDWAEKYGFEYAIGTLPMEWLK